MIVYAILLLVTVSALSSFTLQQKTHCAIGVLMGLVVLGMRELSTMPGSQSKIVLNSCAVFNPSVALRGLLLVRATIGLLFLWGNDGSTTMLVVFLAGAGARVVSAQTSALLVTGVELQSYVIYTLVTLGRIHDYRPSSVAVYFLVGALGTAGIMLGWRWLYGVGGLADPLQGSRGAVGNLAQTSGIIAKTGCFPFSQWLPLAYNGLALPTLRTAGVLPQVSLISQIGGVMPFGLTWAYGIARSSVYVGSLLAAAVTPLRQLLALSGTAHIGYLVSGVPFSLYPLLTYSLSYAVVLVLFCLRREKCAFNTPVQVSDLRGALNSFLLEGLALHAASLNLGGVPPLLGFYAKIFILLGGVALGNLQLQVFCLALGGAVGMVAYLRVGLTLAGYPQTNGYLLAPAVGLGEGRRGLLLGVSLLGEALTGSFHLSLLV